MNLFNHRSRLKIPAPRPDKSQPRGEKLRQQARPPIEKLMEPPQQPETQAARPPIPPVTVRNPRMGTPLRSRVATANPRRQVYVPLSTPGTELRLPALPQVHIGLRITSFLLAAACALGMYLMMNSSLFILTAPVLDGMHRLNPVDVETTIGSTGLNAIEANLKDFEKALLQRYDILETAQASIVFPNELHIRVTERTPALIWKVGDVDIWADAKGFLFNPAGDPVELLTIYGDAKPPTTYAPERQKAIQDAETRLASVAQMGASSRSYQLALAELEEAHRNSGPEMVPANLFRAVQKLTEVLPPSTQLLYSGERGLGWQDQGGWDVFIGTDLTNFNQKFNLYEQVIRQLARQGITPAVVSVENTDTPYYRLER